ncbi:MAG: hypothetical protein AAB772_00955, partial [Patescibacteria group bacterium]
MENKYSDNKPLEYKPFATLGNIIATEELKPAPASVKPIVVKLPSIKKLESLDAKMANAVRQATEQQQYLNQIGNYIADLVAQLIRLDSMSRMEKEALADSIQEYEHELIVHLAPQVQSGKNGRLPLSIWKARVAYAEAMIVSATKRDSLFAAIEGSKFHKNLPGLIQLGVMERVGQVAKAAVIVQVFTETYKLNGSRDEAMRLKELLETAVKRIKAVNSAYYAELKAVLSKNATIDPRHIYTGIKGSAVLDVPTVNDAGQRVPGGSMQVESNGENIKVVVAIGYFQRVMQDL